MPLKGRPGGGGWRRRGWRRLEQAAGIAIVSLLLSAGPAAAEQQPAILEAYGLDWIERIKEDAWAEPKERRPVVCLLDTGVAVTPDTPADNPLGPIVARLSLEDPADQPMGAPPLGLPQGDSWTHLHGTRMAAIIGAPRNGEGTVGVFPQVRIVSVRVTVGTETFITPADVVHGVRRCRRWAETEKVRVGAVVMAESNYDQRDVDESRWTTAAADAAQSGAPLVAAAGNDPEARLMAPSTVASVFSVGAGDGGGSRCGFVADTNAGKLLGPGCGANWPAGSSSATAVTGAVVAVMATLLPDLGAEALVKLVQDAGVTAPDGSRRLSGTGLAAWFPSKILPRPAAPGTPGIAVTGEGRTAPADKAEPRLRLIRPKVRARWNRGRVTVTRRDRHTSGVFCVTLGTQAPAHAVCGRRRVLSIKSKRKPPRVVAWIESKDRATWRSLRTTSRVSR